MIQEREVTDNHTGLLEYPYGRGINFQIVVPDIEAVERALGAIEHPLRSPVKENWRQISESTLVGSRELQVLDPDGYYLRFSQEIGTKPFIA